MNDVQILPPHTPTPLPLPLPLLRPTPPTDNTLARGISLPSV